MLISYKTVYSVLQYGYKIQSKKEFLEANKEEIKNSFTTAELIEDYEYLSVMTDEAVNNHDNLMIVYSPNRLILPTIIEKDKSLTLYEFSKLFCDAETRIDKTIFYQAIEKEAISQDMEPTSLLLQFDIYVDNIKGFRKLTETKVQRNDPCPCGSGEKYKNCHGKSK
jgi:uncharacterized protein YchJ